MKYVDEYRDPAAVQALAREIARAVTRPWTIMEICGGQTHAILRFGLDRLLPENISLIHGPGCPVCVTAPALIDAAIALAHRPGLTVCTYGDMLRVPGSATSLLAARAAGADVRVTYSPLDALDLARREPARQVVFFAVGFETTAPATALAARQAQAEGVGNFSLLSAHVRVPPAIEEILAAPDNRVQGFLAAGHVCTIMGWTEYEPLAARFRTPIVVTGFEPTDILQGILHCVRQLEAGQALVENQYSRSAHREGNPAARAMLAAVFEPVDRHWRGIGTIPGGGMGLCQAFAAYDAARRFDLRDTADEAATECIAGLVLRGIKKPVECPAFGTRCTPEQPLGAPMVSSEGACAAYFRYR